MIPLRPDDAGPPLVLAVVGPTAAGKSELALRLAQRVGGEIVNLDSRQIYRGLDIGTDKLPISSRLGIPHHGLDLIEPTEVMSAAAFLEFARDAVGAIVARGRIPMLVGGTGFYLRALREGLSELPGTDPALRRVLKAWFRKSTTDAASRWLRLLDPERALELSPADRDRTLRAVEVALASGRPMSRWLRGERRGRIEARWLVLGCRRERVSLYARINSRVNFMFDSGLVDEVRGCLAAGIPADAPGLSAIGYREVVRLLAGETSEADARDDVAKATRHYAKRQLTWFRSEPGIEWFDLDEGEPAITRAVDGIVARIARAGADSGSAAS